MDVRLPVVKAACLLLKVVQSAFEIKPAVTPEAEASGMFRVWTELAELHAGAVPAVPGVANVCDVAVSPLSEVSALLVRLERGIFLISPDVIVNKLSDNVPGCTPVNVSGLVPTICKVVAGKVVPIPTLPVLKKILFPEVVHWLLAPYCKGVHPEAEV